MAKSLPNINDPRLGLMAEMLCDPPQLPAGGQGAFEIYLSNYEKLDKELSEVKITLPPQLWVPNTAVTLLAPDGWTGNFNQNQGLCTFTPTAGYKLKGLATVVFTIQGVQLPTQIAMSYLSVHILYKGEWYADSLPTVTQNDDHVSVQLISNTLSVTQGGSATLSWVSPGSDVALKLYGGGLPSAGQDVTGLTSYSVTPKLGDSTYTLQGVKLDPESGKPQLLFSQLTVTVEMPSVEVSRFVGFHSGVGMDGFSPEISFFWSVKNASTVVLKQTFPDNDERESYTLYDSSDQPQDDQSKMSIRKPLNLDLNSGNYDENFGTFVLIVTPKSGDHEAVKSVTCQVCWQELRIMALHPTLEADGSPLVLIASQFTPFQGIPVSLMSSNWPLSGVPTPSHTSGVQVISAWGDGKGLARAADLVRVANGYRDFDPIEVEVDAGSSADVAAPTPLQTLQAIAWWVAIWQKAPHWNLRDTTDMTVIATWNQSQCEDRIRQAFGWASDKEISEGDLDLCLLVGFLFRSLPADAQVMSAWEGFVNTTDVERRVALLLWCRSHGLPDAFQQIVCDLDVRSAVGVAITLYEQQSPQQPTEPIWGAAAAAAAPYPLAFPWANPHGQPTKTWNLPCPPYKNIQAYGPDPALYVVIGDSSDPKIRLRSGVEGNPSASWERIVVNLPYPSNAWSCFLLRNRLSGQLLQIVPNQFDLQAYLEPNLEAQLANPNEDWLNKFTFVNFPQFNDTNTNKFVQALSSFPDQKLLLNAWGSFQDGTNVGMYNAGYVQDNEKWFINDLNG